MFSKFVLVFAFCVTISHQGLLKDNITRLANQADKFLYFAYGSNMLAKRIHMNNPSAILIGPGEVKNYRLEFHTYSKRWDGAKATIVPDNSSTVFGSVWHIDIKDMESLDRQEGVGEGIYIPLSVPLEVHGVPVFARSYLLTDQPTTAMNDYLEVPEERRPSKTYLQCIVKGAVETGLSPMYIHYLRQIQHNGKIVPHLQSHLELDGVEILK